MANIASRHAVAAMALLAESGAAPVADESGIRASKPHTFNVPTTAFTYALVDVLLCVDGEWAIVEVNGANGAGSIAHAGDVPRVQHLLDTLLVRGVGGDVVAVAYQHDTPCRPEIFARAAQIATALEERTGKPVSLVGPAARDDPNGSCVLIGTTEEVASVLAVATDGRLSWRGRGVALLSNGNVLPALQRRGAIRRLEDVDLRVLHEGQAVLAVIFDKGRQQDLAAGTGFRRLEWGVGGSEEEAVAMIERLSAERAVVVKINAGSGGTGVFPVPKAASTNRIRAFLSTALRETAVKYGSTKTAFPVRAFEFAEAVGLDHEGKKHLWDLRLQVLARPGAIEVTPLSARICPAPFTGDLEPAAMISNLTGAVGGLERVISADELFRRLGVSDTQVGRLAGAAASWTVNALRGFPSDFRGPHDEEEALTDSNR